MSAKDTGGSALLPVPRVERRTYNGPDGFPYTEHWVVVTVAGPLLNAKGRVKKFRRHYTANAARSALAARNTEATP